jgi:hypothetical protein
MYYTDKVILEGDPHHQSGVNREAFVDQQEWLLYQRVGIEQRYAKEFLVHEIDKKDDDEDIGEKIDNTEGRKRPIITVTCHAGLSFFETEFKYIFFSSSLCELFLLEWLLFGLVYNVGIFLHIFYSSTVSHSE